MNGKNLSAGVLSAPVVGTGVDLYRDVGITETMSEIAKSVGSVIEGGAASLGSTFGTVASGAIGGLSAGLVSNDILNQFEYFETHKKTKWLLNALTSVGCAAGAIAGGSTVAGFLAVGGAGYAAGRFGWKYAKNIAGAVMNPYISSFNQPFRAIKGGWKHGPMWPWNNKNYDPVFGEPTSTSKAASKTKATSTPATTAAPAAA